MISDLTHSVHADGGAPQLEHGGLWWAAEGHGFQLYAAALKAFILNPIHTVLKAFFCHFFFFLSSVSES